LFIVENFVELVM